jgi:alanyl-tRNA synthetase
LLVAAAADTGMDAGSVLKAALEASGGRGGGSPRLAQGSVKDPAALDAAVAAVLARLG